MVFVNLLSLVRRESFVRAGTYSAQALIDKWPKPKMEDWAMSFFDLIVTRTDIVSICATATIGLVLFRRQFKDILLSISGAINRLSFAKHGDLTAEFRSTLKEADRAVASVSPDDASQSKAGPFQRWEGTTPRNAILVLWVDVERELRYLAELTIPECFLNAPPVSIAALLRHSGVIDEDEMQAIIKLRNTRYIAAKTASAVKVSEEEANKFSESAYNMAAVLEQRKKVYQNRRISPLRGRI